MQGALRALWVVPETLEVVCMQLEVALRMCAYRAHLRCLLAHYHMATVAADPDSVAVAREYEGILDVLEQLAIALLVALLDGSHAAHLECDLCEAFLLSLTSHALVHVCPLIVLALGSSSEVLFRRTNLATFLQILEPELSVLSLVEC